MGDVFIERMVKKKFDTKDILIIVGIVLAVMVLMPILLLLSMQYGLFMIGLLAAAGLVFGGYKLLTMRMLEYEYSLTNGYISIDKIMNRSSRKRMTAFECSSAEDIGAVSYTHLYSLGRGRRPWCSGSRPAHSVRRKILSLWEEASPPHIWPSLPRRRGNPARPQPGFYPLPSHSSAGCYMGCIFQPPAIRPCRKG